MAGLYIESKPLTPEMAKALIELISNASIVGSAAGNFLMLTVSLQRITDGTDEVLPKKEVT